jgi:hypothetical protein
MADGVFDRNIFRERTVLKEDLDSIADGSFGRLQPLSGGMK